MLDRVYSSMLFADGDEIVIYRLTGFAEYLVGRGGARGGYSPAELAQKSQKEKNNGLSAVASYRNFVSVTMFLAAGADAEESGALFSAIGGWRSVSLVVPIISVLIEAGANVNTRDRNGRTPLHDALDDFSAAAYLLSMGASVNIANNLGDTPLHIAVLSSSRAAVVSLLVGHGADPFAENNDGDTPLDKARDWEAGPTIIAMLEAAMGLEDDSPAVAASVPVGGRMKLHGTVAGGVCGSV